MSDGVTLRDVAQSAGVSVATASRALAGRGELSRSTRERVMEAARDLGYDRAAAVGGRPATYDSTLIELVLDSFEQAWTAKIAIGARDAAFRLGFDLVFTLERPDPANDWPARVAARRPAGVILGIIRPTHTQLEHIVALQIPVVLIDPRSDPDGALTSVGTTDWQGGYDAGAHLAACEVSRFVVVNGSPPYRFGRAREEGFRAALAEHRPDARTDRIESEWTDAPVDRSLLTALSGPDPVGVFACNDEMAFAVYRAAHELGRAIPHDISVVGFNDEPRARTTTPPLTSVHQPLGDMAARAVELVAQMRRGEHTTHERIELPTELIVRGSTSWHPRG